MSFGRTSIFKSHITLAVFIGFIAIQYGSGLVPAPIGPILSLLTVPVAMLYSLTLGTVFAMFGGSIPVAQATLDQLGMVLMTYFLSVVIALFVRKQRSSF